MWAVSLSYHVPARALCYNGAVEDPERYPITGGVSMAVYMVERDLRGITMEQRAGAQRAAIETSQRFTAGGKPVRYIRTTFVPGEARCMCLFEAASAAAVREAN